MSKVKINLHEATNNSSALCLTRHLSKASIFLLKYKIRYANMKHFSKIDIVFAYDLKDVSTSGMQT